MSSTIFSIWATKKVRNSINSGNVYFYPVRVNDPDIIAKSTQEQSKNITKYKIDKLQCYPGISSIFVLADEKLFIVDSALRKPEIIAQKVKIYLVRFMILASIKGIKKEDFTVWLS